jgi:hypothetical protein
VPDGHFRICIEVEAPLFWRSYGELGGGALLAGQLFRHTLYRVICFVGNLPFVVRDRR